MALTQIPVRVINGTSVVPTVSAAVQSNTTGTITANAQVVTVTDLVGIGAVTVAINGTFAGVNLTFEYSPDNGANWYLISGQNAATGATTTATGALSAAASYSVTPLLGADQFRVRATAYTSGTANITIHPSVQFTAPWVTVNGSVNLGTAGTSATSLGKAEDAVHASGDTGVAAWNVRNDGAATSFSSANGDYTPSASDAQGRTYVVQKSAVATLTNVTSSASSVTILAANAARIGAQIFNDSTAMLYLKFGATASTSSFTVPLAASNYYEVPAGYTGIIDGVWASANGFARVTEET